MDNFAVSLVKELCPICGKEMDGPIIMNSRLTEKSAQEVKNLQGKVIGWSNKACDECSKHKDAVVYIISIDPKQSTDTDFYRTGHIIGIDKNSDFITSIDPKYILTTEDGVKYMFCEYELGIMIGLWE